jgi:hypothetical protein
MRRALLAGAAAVALLLVPAAWANGDPASDVLITEQVFIGPEVQLPSADQDDLEKTVAAANDKGFKIRVALIPFTGDLGTAVSLWRHPQNYADFLGSELAFAYTGRVLIAMPSGFGIHHGLKPVTKERRVLARVRAGQTPAELARSTTAAVRALAAANGITLPTNTHKSTAWRDRIIIAVAGVLILLIIVVPGRWLRRSRRPEPVKDPGGGQ